MVRRGYLESAVAVSFAAVPGTTFRSTSPRPSAAGTSQAGGAGSVTHTYATGGTYDVKLVLVDTNYCNEPDSIIKQIRI